MSGWLEIGAACAIASATTTIEPTETGWHEQVRYDVLSSGGCKTLALHTDAGTTAVISGRIKLGDGTRRKLIPERLELLESGLDGETVVLVHLNDMLSGDGVRLDVDRTWTTDGSYRWTPHREPALWSELRAGKQASLTSYGEVEIDRKRGEAWVTSATASDTVALPSSLPEAFSRTPDLAPVSEAGLSLAAAQEKMAGLLLQPRVVDGTDLVVGDAALARGIVDDRGWARTLVALTDGGPDRVELGHLLPRNSPPGELRDAVTELAVVYSETGPRPLVHPSVPSWQGNVQTPSTHQTMTWTQVAPASEQEILTLNREMELGWDGNPQYALAPGAGSWVTTTDTIELPADYAATFFLPLPVDAQQLTIDAADTRSTRNARGLLFAAARGERRTLTISYRQDDAPTYGEKPTISGFAVDQQVRVEGKVRWEDRAWRLSRAGSGELLPSRDALLRALDWRFAILAYPEPALPLLLKGRTGSWEAAADLPEALRSRVRPAPLDTDPLWPRKLLRARRSGVVTSVEAALFASQWAKAMQMNAMLVLVRPAPRGPGPRISPASYSDGIVVIEHAGEIRWLDPYCTVCAPFELRPDMEGASAYAWEIDETPQPSHGLLVATTTDTTDFTLEGSAALSLRLALQPGLGEGRADRTATWLAGSGATLTAVDGLAEAGLPVKATVTGGQPQFWPTSDADGSTWMPWVGERRWVGAPAGPDAAYDSEQLRWTRTTADGVTTESLTILERRISPEQRATLEAVQAGPAPEAAEEVAPESDPSASDEPAPSEGSVEPAPSKGSVEPAPSEGSVEP